MRNRIFRQQRQHEDERLDTWAVLTYAGWSVWVAYYVLSILVRAS